MTARPRILPRRIWQDAYQDYIPEKGEPIRAIRLLHQIPDFLACIGGVALLCTAIIIASEIIQ